jgi:hypothetical protein
MTRILSLAVLSSMMALGFAGGASAEPRYEHGHGMRHGLREQCSIVKRCHQHHGRMSCEKEKVCKMVRVGRDWDRR